MEYIINPVKWNTSFVVPAEVVDKYLRLAGSVQIKVLLWFMRHSADEKSIEELSKDIGVSVADCADALTFWTETGILVKSDNIQHASVKPEPEIIKNEPEKVTHTAKILPEIEPIKPTAEQVAARGVESEEIRFLFNEAQSRLGKTIGYDGQSVLLMMHDSYGLPVEVIVTILEYCASVGKTSTAYISKIGKDWSEKEIDTLEKADEMINELKSVDGLWNDLRVKTGISNPRPTSAQMKYLNQWKNHYGFSIDMIYLAYEESANNIQKISFPYMDKVLNNWFKDGIKTIDDVDKAKKERQNFVANPILKPEKVHKKKSSYDIDEILKANNQTELVYKKKGDDD
ncbi:MAG: DnaD domain protein [Ruminococcaceae bacterium]|nr:DnaD domain protein [Oscillospiraceae bacterium]